MRSARVRQPRDFLRRRGRERIDEHFVVDGAELPFEYMLNVLRLTDGFEEAAFQARTGLAFATIAESVAHARRKGLLEISAPGQWQVTELGQRFLNDLQAMFLPQRPAAASTHAAEGCRT